MGNQITVTGNTSKTGFELRFTQGGVATGSFSVAATNSRLDKPTNEWVDLGDPLWFRVITWREMAEQLAEQMRDETSYRVTVTGHLEKRSYETREGEKREVTELMADSVYVHPPRLKFNDPQPAAPAVVNVPTRQPAARPGGWGAPSGSEAPF